jgi:hypothetical protein
MAMAACSHANNVQSAAAAVLQHRKLCFTTPAPVWLRAEGRGLFVAR